MVSKILTTAPPGSPDWHKAHEGKLGCGSIADVFGVGRRSAYSRWAIITGREHPDDISELPFIKFGNRMEEPVAQWWADETGLALDPSPGVVQHPRLPFLVGTPDRLIRPSAKNPLGVLEVKTTAGFFKSDWEFDVPVKHQFQGYGYMGCLDVDWCSFGALAGNEFLFKHMAKDPTFQSWMEEELAAWWDRHVTKDTPPPIDGTQSSLQTLVKLHPDDNGASIILSPAAIQASEELEALVIQSKEVESAILERKNLIRAEIGDNTFGILPSGRWRWQTQNRKAYEVAASTSRVLLKMK